MPLEYSEFLIFLLCIVLIAVVLFAFTMGMLWRGNSILLKRKERKEKPKPKPKHEVKSPSKPVPPNPCLLAAQGGYVGVLRKEWKKAGADQPYPPCCYPSEKNPKGCEFFLKCVGVEK